MAAQKVQTVIIDNFSGELTSELIGKLNSGLTPIGTSPFGKAVFANQFKAKGLKPMEYSYSIGGTAISATMLHTIKNWVSNPTISGVDSEGGFYNIGVAAVSVPTPDVDSVVKFSNSVGDTLHYGGGLFYDTNAQVLVVGTDSGAYVSSSNPLINPTTATFSAVTGSWNLSGVPRPICFFLGTLYVGDGNKLVALNSNYTAIGNNSVLNPTLPPGYCIRSLALSQDGRYLIITASLRSTTNDFIVTNGPQPQYQPIDTVVLQWNGSDPTYSSLQVFKGLNIVSVVSSSTDMIMFGKNMDGVAIYDINGNVLATVVDVSDASYPGTPNFAMYPPLLYSVDAVGRLFFFMMQLGQQMFIYLFDASSGKLYSLYSAGFSTTGIVVGGLSIASLHANATVSGSLVEATRSKLYFFWGDLGGPAYHKSALHLQNYGGGVQCVYTTQVEEFERKVKPVRIRVYALSVGSGATFLMRLWDASFNNLTGNLTYTYASGTDLTKAQGALTKIEFGLNSRYTNGYMFNLNINGPMFVERVEIDYVIQENPTSI